jgi:hypothetical protein
MRAYPRLPQWLGVRRSSGRLGSSKAKIAKVVFPRLGGFFEWLEKNDVTSFLKLAIEPRHATIDYVEFDQYSRGESESPHQTFEACLML